MHLPRALGSRPCGLRFRPACSFTQAICLLWARPATAQLGDSLPSTAYMNSFGTSDGGLADALITFQSELQGAIKAPGGIGRTIDSVCYYTMCGECYYQIGQNTKSAGPSPRPP